MSNKLPRITGEQLNQIANLLREQGLEPTKDMVISVTLGFLAEQGFTAKEAWEMLFGEGSYKKLADTVYAMLRQAN